LVLAYGLHKKMDIYEPHRASINEMMLFHSEDYIKHLKNVCPVIYHEDAKKAAHD
jgi:acetoin utilization deacetylase AcuC-like enzyme